MSILKSALYSRRAYLVKLRFAVIAGTVLGMPSAVIHYTQLVT